MRQVLTNAPTEDGLYWFSCDEIGYEEEIVNLKFDDDGVLNIDDEDFFISNIPVSFVHDGLTNPTWIKIF